MKTPTIDTLLKQIDDAYKIYHLQDTQGKYKSILQRASTRLTYTSNALEWNTLSEQETSLIINDNISVAGKNLIEIQEAINHAKAVDYILSLVKDISISFLWQKELCCIHNIILHDINNEYAGIYRNIPVRIQGSQTILPNYAKVPTLIGQWENNLKKSTQHIVLMAIQAHYDIVTIHPFIDGNGRTARLFMNLILSLRWYPLISIDPSLREEYLLSLERYQTKWENEPYMIFMLTIIRDTLLDYTRL